MTSLVAEDLHGSFQWLRISQIDPVIEDLLGLL